MPECCDCLQRLAVLEATVHERRTADIEALRLAASAVDRRMETMNQFRDQLREQAAKFITRDEHAVLQEDIGRLATAVQDAATKAELDTAVQDAATKAELDTAVQDAATKAELDTVSHREDDRDRINEGKIATLTTQFWIGGSGIIVVLGILQVVLNYAWHHS